MHLTVRLRERGSAGAPIVHDERTFIHFGQESGADQCVAHRPCRQQADRGARHRAGVMQGDGEQPFIADGERIEPCAKPRQCAARRSTWHHPRIVLGIGRGEELGRQQRDDGQCERQRDQHRDREGQRQCREELPNHPLEQPERQEDHHRRDRRRRHWPDQLLHRFAHRGGTVVGNAKVSDDVLGDDHGIIDDQADRDGHGPECHQVERLPEQLHQEHGDEQRQRDDGRTDRGDAQVAQEREEDGDGEQGPDQHRVAHRADGVTYQHRLIVDGREPDAWWECLHEAVDRAGHAIRHGDRVATDLSRDVDEGRRSPVAGDDAHVILGAGNDAREIAHAHPTLHDHVGDVLRGVGLLRGDHEVLLVVSRHAPNGIHGNSGPDGRRQIGVRETRDGQARGVGDHFDLAHVRALHDDPPDTRDAREHRLDLVPGDVVQRRGVAALEVVRQDREERRSEALHLDGETRWQFAGQLLDARPHQLQRVRHVRLLAEGDRDLAATADRT